MEWAYFLCRMACLEPYQSYTFLSLGEVICLGSADRGLLFGGVGWSVCVYVWWLEEGVGRATCLSLGNFFPLNWFQPRSRRIQDSDRVFYRFLALFCNIVYTSITEYLPFGLSYWNHHQENSFVRSKPWGSIWNEDLLEHDLDATKCLSQNGWASNVVCDKTSLIIEVNHLLAPKLSRVCTMSQSSRSWIMLIVSFSWHASYKYCLPILF